VGEGGREYNPCLHVNGYAPQGGEGHGAPEHCKGFPDTKAGQLKPFLTTHQNSW